MNFGLFKKGVKYTISLYAAFYFVNNYYNGVVREAPLYLLNKLEKKSSNMDALPTSEVIRGEYENKIRQESTVEKIFEIFSTKKRDFQLFLSYSDLIKSIIPFNYTEASENKVEKVMSVIEKKFETPFYKLFDIDKSEDIDLVEYLFFNIIHRMSVDDITGYFGNNINNISKLELKNYLRDIQKKNKLYITNSFILDPRANKLTKDDIKKSEDNIIDLIFKGKESLGVGDFINFKSEISKQIYFSEYLWLLDADVLESNDDSKLTISKEQFCKNVISYIHPKDSKWYLDKIDNIDINGEFTFEDFFNFKKLICLYPKLMDDLFESYGMISRSKYNKLILKFADKSGITINDNMRDIFFKLIDIDNSGYIDNNEYLRTISRIRSMGRSETKEDVNNTMKPIQLLYDSYETFIDKSYRIYKIIIE